MKLFEVIDKLAEEVTEFNQIVKDKEIITYCDSYREYRFEHEENEYIIIFSVYTLRILNYSKLPNIIARTIRLKMRDKKLIRDSAFIERNAFIDFLHLWLGEEWDNIQFIDREKPDFCIIINGKTFGIELSEAISQSKGSFNTMLRNMTGRGKSKEEYHEYINEKHKSYSVQFQINEVDDSIILSDVKGMTNTSNLRKLIVNAIVVKINKYKEYDDNFDFNLILIHFQGVGYSNEYDFKEVESMLKAEFEKCFENEFIDRFFVSSGLNEVLVEYGKDGSFIKGTVDNGV